MEILSPDRTRSSTDTYSNSDTQYHTPGKSTTTATDRRYGFNDTANPAPAGIAETVTEPDLTKRELPTGTSAYSELQFTLQGTDVTRDTGTDSTNSNGTEGENITRENRTKGNIGVTTTQQMIQSEREVVRYDFLEDVINDFKARFCLMVY